IGRQPLDRGDRLAGDLRHLGLAGVSALAVDVHHAGAAQAGATAELGAGELEAFPDHPQQRRSGRRIGRGRLAIHSEARGHALLPEKANSDGERRMVPPAYPPFTIATPYSLFYVSAAFTRAGLSGRSRMRLPVALAKALTTAATAGPCEPSPEPSGRSFGRLISSISTFGTSGMVRIG